MTGERYVIAVVNSAKQAHNVCLQMWAMKAPEVAILVIGALLGCGSPRRPNGVPDPALWCPSAKTGYWKHCQIGPTSAIECAVWNEGGSVLINERFLPSDGNPDPEPRELLLRSENCSGPYEVSLANGRILVPQSMIDRWKGAHSGGP